MSSSSPAHSISGLYSFTRPEHLPSSTAEAPPLALPKGAQCTDVHSTHAHSQDPKYNMNTARGEKLSYSAASHLQPPILQPPITPDEHTITFWAGEQTAVPLEHPQCPTATEDPCSDDQCITQKRAHASPPRQRAPGQSQRLGWETSDPYGQKVKPCAPLP